MTVPIHQFVTRSPAILIGMRFSPRQWFHFTGITPALSESAAELSLEAVRAAKANNVIVSCDFNYRGKLWNYGKTAPEVMTELVKYVDVGIANEEDCQKSLGVTADVEVEPANWTRNMKHYLPK